MRWKLAKETKDREALTTQSKKVPRLEADLEEVLGKSGLVFPQINKCYYSYE